MTVVGTVLSEHPLAAHAVGETVGHLLEVGGPRPDLLAVFATGAHIGALEDIVGAVRRLLDPRTMIGATAHAVGDVGREVEGRAVLGMFALWVGGTAIRPIRLDAVSGPTTSPERLAGAEGTLLILTDPFSLPAEQILAGLAGTAPQLAVVGAGASALRPGGNRLLLGADIHDSGAVALHIEANAGLRAAVSTGRRPIGAPLTVTAADGLRIHALGGRPAVDRMHEATEGLDDTHRSRLVDGLALGQVLDERNERPAPGGFTVHELRGRDPATGALVVAEEIPVGATVQFHITDPTVAVEEVSGQLAGVEAVGGLCFTDVGRCSTARRPTLRGADVDTAAGGAALSTATLIGMTGAGTVGRLGGRPRTRDPAASLLVVDRRRR